MNMSKYAGKYLKFKNSMAMSDVVFLGEARSLSGFGFRDGLYGSKRSAMDFECACKLDFDPIRWLTGYCYNDKSLVDEGTPSEKNSFNENILAFLSSNESIVKASYPRLIEINQPASSWPSNNSDYYKRICEDGVAGDLSKQWSETWVTLIREYVKRSEELVGKYFDAGSYGLCCIKSIIQKTTKSNRGDAFTIVEGDLAGVFMQSNELSLEFHNTYGIGMLVRNIKSEISEDQFYSKMYEQFYRVRRAAGIV